MMNLQDMAVINDLQIVGCTPWKFYSQITWYYIQASVILLVEGGKEKAYYDHVDIIIIIEAVK